MQTEGKNMNDLEFITELETLKKLESNYTEDIQKEIRKQEECRLKYERYEKMITFMESLREILTKKVQAVFEEIQNLALKDIIEDRNYQFKTDINHKYNKPNFDVFMLKEFNGVRNLCNINNGGSGLKAILRISSLVSILLLMKRNRILVVDEEMTAVSKDNDNGINYLENLILWLKEVLAKFDIQFILVTHEKGIQEHADKKFKIQINTDGNAQIV